MFSGLRQQSILYILEKGSEPQLKIGTVTFVSNPQPKFNNYSSPFPPQPSEMVVDITVNVDDKSTEFKQVPADLSIANFGPGIIISDNRESMIREIENMAHSSKQILDSVKYHQSQLQSCEKILRDLNPHFAKEKEQEEKIGSLEEKVGNIQDTLGSMMDMLSGIVGKNGKKSKEE